MKLAIRTSVLDYKGEPVEEPIGQEPLLAEGKPVEGPDGKVLLRTITRPLIWEGIIFAALNYMDPQKPLTSEEKQRCYQICHKTFADGDPDYTVEERAYIIKKIDELYNPLVCGRAREFFDGHENGAAPSRAARRREAKAK